MPTLQAKREMKNILISGYEHYSREEERNLIGKLLKGDLKILEAYSSTQFVLASQPLRSIKNSIICLVAVTCRYAADIGADDKRCFVMSDYYINEVEKMEEVEQAHLLIADMLTNYHDLVQEGLSKTYTLPIQRVIRYIYKHLYEPCRLETLAQEVKLHPVYLSSLFKTEVGMNLTRYVREQKMEEARKLLFNTEFSISEIAEMLGYNSLSYFSKVFSAHFKSSPRKFALSGLDSSENMA
jgi:YesN/AraC family two-component response regulator